MQLTSHCSNSIKQHLRSIVPNCHPRGLLLASHSLEGRALRNIWHSTFFFLPQHISTQCSSQHEPPLSEIKISGTVCLRLKLIGSHSHNDLLAKWCCQLVSAASSPTRGTLWWSRQRRHLSEHRLPHLPQALHLTLSLWGTDCYCRWMHESGLTLRNLNCWHWKTAGWRGMKTFTWRECQQKFRGSTCPRTYQFPLCLQSFFFPLHTGHKVRYHHSSAWPFSYKGCNLHGFGLC